MIPRSLGNVTLRMQVALTQIKLMYLGITSFASGVCFAATGSMGQPAGWARGIYIRIKPHLCM